MRPRYRPGHEAQFVPQSSATIRAAPASLRAEFRRRREHTAAPAVQPNEPRHVDLRRGRSLCPPPAMLEYRDAEAVRFQKMRGQRFGCFARQLEGGGAENYSQPYGTSPKKLNGCRRRSECYRKRAPAAMELQSHFPARFDCQTRCPGSAEPRNP